MLMLILKNVNVNDKLLFMDDKIVVTQICKLK